MASAPEVLTTPRLHARRVRADDFAAMHALYGDARVMKAIAGADALTEAESAARVALYTKHWDDRGYGLYVADYEGELAGHIMLLRRPLREGLDAVEVGYAFRPQFWGRGLATEGTRALLGVAFDVLGEPEAVAITSPQHAASRRVLEKNGMTLRDEFSFGGKAVVLYGITQAQWRSQTKPSSP